MSNCDFCNRTELLPFTCKYCGRTFCAEHQLPENHHCQMKRSNFISMQKIHKKGFDVTYTRASLFRTSRTEIFHLIAGILVFFIVDVAQFIQFGLTIVLIMLFIIASAFTLHEIGHKLMAQQYGLWSEFRLNPFGVVISLLTAFSPFKIIAPGAVLIFGGGGTKESIGKIAMVGPLTNLIQALVFIFLAQFIPIFWIAAILNAELAIFNLIPVSILDGQKIFTWNKTVWGMFFVISIILLIFIR